MADTNPATSVDPEALTATQNLIGRLSVQLDELQTKLKEVREMLKGVFENDPKLNEAESQAEALNQAIKTRKADLNQSQEVMDLKMKITELTEDTKLVGDSLNTHLINYYQMTSSMTVDMPDGTERDFTLKATLKPKKKS